MADVMQAHNIAGDDLATTMTDQDALAAFHDQSIQSTSFLDADTWDWDAVGQTLQDSEEAASHIASRRDGDHHHEAQRVDTPPQDHVADMEEIPTEALEGKDDGVAEEVMHTQGFAEDDYELPQRELRAQIREKRTFATTWIDNDETGNYDPEEEKRRERSKRAKLRASTQQRLHREVADQASDEEVSDLSEEFTSEASEPARLVVPLTFTSQAKKAAFAGLLSKLAAQEHSDKVGYKLRRRSKNTATQLSSTQGANSGISTDIDLTAKPFARGCWGCTTTGTCSLLHDERTWPCQTCYEDDLDCEPIIPPVRKRACEMCKRRKGSCSYTYTRRHGASCEQCERVGQRCVAGPVKDFIRPRISYDRDWELDPLPKRRGGKQKELEDCLECVGGGRSCSYPAGCHGSPCEECTTRGLPCTIASNASAASASPAQSAAPALSDAIEVAEKTSASRELLALAKPRSIGQVKVQERSAMVEHQLQKPKGTTRKIYTSFPHPIIFNCDVGDNQADSCYFCTEPELPKLGFGLIHPEVVDWSDGRSFIEVKGGHTHVNLIERTKLCYACTSSRLAIVACYRHNMRRIVSRDVGQRVSEQVQPCHVCDGNATYECTPHDQDTAGCGLQLCRPCAVILSRDHAGYLGRMLGTLAESQESPTGRTLRADGEFLKEDGHIARYMKSLDT